MPLDRLSWPFGQPERLKGKTVARLNTKDHLLAYLSSGLMYMPRPHVRAKVSVMLVEPQAVHGQKMAWMRVLRWRFFRVLTCNPSLLSAIPNGVRFLFGSTWVPEWRETDMSKSRMLSLIASQRNYYPGHKLRHEVVAFVRKRGADIDVLGRGYAPFERKSDGLAPFRYSVIIENVRETSYFTEKLIDAFLCETVPIYWGAPDIGDFFDKRGMIIADDLAAIIEAIEHLSINDYAARLEFVRLNKDKAKRYADHEKAAAHIILREDARSRKIQP